VHLHFVRALGITLSILVIWLVLSALSTLIVGITRPPVPLEPNGLAAMEIAENREMEKLIEDATYLGPAAGIETQVPVDPDAPEPRFTRLYNNLLDNLLSGLHYFFRVEENTPPSTFVTSWDADTGSRVLSDEFFVSMETNVSYLLTLEMYRRMHTKAVFDEDLDFARARVDAIFTADWHTSMDLPLGVYFDLIDLAGLTGEDKYIQYAEKYALGDGPSDLNTPYRKAMDLALKVEYDSPRMASPFFFYQAAFLADYGSRRNPELLTQAKDLFNGLTDLLFDRRFNLLYKQASIPAGRGGVRNIIQTFNTLEQLSAIQAIVRYYDVTNDAEALSLAKQVFMGVWGAGSTLLIEAPSNMPGSTYYGLYTGYDREREAKRDDPGERTIDQILTFVAVVSLNGATRGEYRNDIDFLKGWLEDLGPLYKADANGYLSNYNSGWGVPDQQWVSARAGIWMARGIAEDEWYVYRRARALTESMVEGGGT
jgi:hypothetical protein